MKKKARLNAAEALQEIVEEQWPIADLIIEEAAYDSGLQEYLGKPGVATFIGFEIDGVEYDMEKVTIVVTFETEENHETD